MQLHNVVVEKVLQCKDCVYGKDGKLIKNCGPCEESAIAERIKWWQDGKEKLRNKKC